MPNGFDIQKYRDIIQQNLPGEEGDQYMQQVEQNPDIVSRATPVLAQPLVNPEPVPLPVQAPPVDPLPPTEPQQEYPSIFGKLNIDVDPLGKIADFGKSVGNAITGATPGVYTTPETVGDQIQSLQEKIAIHEDPRFQRYGPEKSSNLFREPNRDFNNEELVGGLRSELHGLQDYQIDQSPIKQSLPRTGTEFIDQLPPSDEYGGISVGDPAQIPQTQDIDAPIMGAQVSTYQKGNMKGADVAPKEDDDVLQSFLAREQATQSEGPTELQKAQKESARRTQIANILSGFNKVMQGVATGGGANIGSGQELVQNLLKQAGAPVEAYKQRQADRGQQLQLTQAEQLADPQSNMSRFLQAQVKKFSPGISDEMLSSTPGQTLLKSMPILQTIIAAEGRKEAASLRATMIKDRLAQRGIQMQEAEQRRLSQAFIRMGQDLEKHPVVKKLNEQGYAFSNIENLMKQVSGGNEVAMAAVGPQFARALGEVGVLTENDVTRYTRAQSLPRAFADKMKKWIQGTPTEWTQDEIKHVSQVFQQGFKHKFQPIYDSYAARMSRNFGIPIEEAYYRLDVPLPQGNVRTAGRYHTGRPIGDLAPRPGPKVGQKEEGYTFKGGDPSSPESWEKL